MKPENQLPIAFLAKTPMPPARPIGYNASLVIMLQDTERISRDIDILENWKNSRNKYLTITNSSEIFPMTTLCSATLYIKRIELFRFLTHILIVHSIIVFYSLKVHASRSNRLTRFNSDHKIKTFHLRNIYLYQIVGSYKSRRISISITPIDFVIHI